jgi:hypothetical protein
MTDTEWTVEEMAVLLDAAPAAPSTMQRVTRSHRVDPAFAQSIKEQFTKERRERAALEARVTGLEGELATVRAEVGVEKRVGNLLDRVQRLEAAHGTSLRSVVG